MKTQHTKNTAIVTINSVELKPIEIEGERVVTLAMVDQLHERPKGTARRNFNTHRAKLVEGEDYRVINQAYEIRTLGLGHPHGGVPQSVTLLTESGYLMLVKPLTDDLAWRVQKALVKSYFAKPTPPPIKPTPQVATAVAREVRLTNAWLVRLAKASGISGNQALIAAGQGTERLMGVNPLGLMGINHLPAPQNENLLCPRDIAKRLGGGVSDRAVNLALTRMGLQTATRDHKGKLQYDPTEAGIKAGGVMMDTGKAHKSGAPVRQLRWASSIVHEVEEAMQQDRAA